VGAPELQRSAGAFLRGSSEVAGPILGTWYSEQSELAQAATSPHARSRSDYIYIRQTTGFLGIPKNNFCAALPGR
jgi:hypothetical protein